MHHTAHRLGLRSARAKWLVPAVAAGTLLSVNGLSPAGSLPLDLIVVITLGALWTAGASAAPPWVLAVAAVAATALTGDPWAIAVGVAVVLLAVSWHRAPDPADVAVRNWRGVVLAAGLAQLLARIRSLGPFGLSTFVALAIGGVVFVAGWRCHSAAEQRVLRRCTITLAALALSCTATFGVTAIDAGPDLLDGGRAARAALRLADAGELDAARASFDAAAHSLRRADRALDAWWGLPARIVPGIAQHRRALEDLARDAARASEQITDILARTDYDALGVNAGRIDLDAIRALDAPIRELDAALADFGEQIETVDTDWLLPPITNLVDELADDVVSKQVQLADLEQAVERAPDMLGADGPRRYFIALTTPAEARGLGGLMGNWAEITADDGRLELTAFGRHQDLLEAAPTTPRLTGMDPEFLAQYGGFVIADTQTLAVGPGVWPNLTAPAHFPWVAETIASLYPQSGGRRLDGVFVMDVYTVAKLMQLTGPVSVPNLGVEITPDNALQYLLRDQYLVTDLDERVDLLDTLARTTIDRRLAATTTPTGCAAPPTRPAAPIGRVGCSCRGAGSVPKRQHGERTRRIARSAHLRLHALQREREQDRRLSRRFSRVCVRTGPRKRRPHRHAHPAVAQHRSLERPARLCDRQPRGPPERHEQTHPLGALDWPGSIHAGRRRRHLVDTGRRTWAQNGLHHAGTRGGRGSSDQDRICRTNRRRCFGRHHASRRGRRHDGARPPAHGEPDSHDSVRGRQEAHTGPDHALRNLQLREMSEHAADPSAAIPICTGTCPGRHE